MGAHWQDFIHAATNDRGRETKVGGEETPHGETEPFSTDTLAEEGYLGRRVSAAGDFRGLRADFPGKDRAFRPKGSNDPGRPTAFWDRQARKSGGHNAWKPLRPGCFQPPHHSGHGRRSLDADAHGVVMGRGVHGARGDLPSDGNSVAQ